MILLIVPYLYGPMIGEIAISSHKGAKYFRQNKLDIFCRLSHECLPLHFVGAKN